MANNDKLVDALSGFLKASADDELVYATLDELAAGIRQIFHEEGYDTIFNHPSMCWFLWGIAPGTDEFRANYRKLYDSGAIDYIRRATMDVYHYEEYFDTALSVLMAYGLSEREAKEQIVVYYDAFGFPSKEPIVNAGKIDEEDCIYLGGIKDGKRNGRGYEELRDSGGVYEKRDSCWYEDKIYGYMRSVDELGTVTYCFCVDGNMKGTVTHVYKNGKILTENY